MYERYSSFRLKIDMSDEREELEHRFASLRKELKGWERLFGRANGGKRPTREDIKANPDIGMWVADDVFVTVLSNLVYSTEI